MFLNQCLQNNSKLIEFAFHAHQQGLILPDTYLLDLDTITENGKRMLNVARQNEVKLFFMLKQLDGAGVRRVRRGRLQGGAGDD